MSNQSGQEKTSKLLGSSKRRAHLGVDIAVLGETKLGNIDSFDNSFLGTSRLDKISRFRMLRRSKMLLGMRSVSEELIRRLEKRREWNRDREITTVLDLFPSLKFSYSSKCGKKFDDSVEIKVSGTNACVGDIARSHSIRLDPVDAPKELYKYRLRIQKIIEWAYAVNVVPIMMTLTIFHRWQNLDSLCRIIGGAWSDLFRGPYGIERKRQMGLVGYIRRMEETFNDGDANFNESCNAGWHPHYHVILLIPREKLHEVSAFEETLKDVWVKLVCRHYKKELGEEVPKSYLPSLRRHGLVFSRYSSVEHARRCGCRHGVAGGLFEVKDGAYLSKLFGLDVSVRRGVESELTMPFSKNGKAPFDLLCGEVTANLADLWCEYAIATKGLACFTFSHGLQQQVDEYFFSRGIREVFGGDSSQEFKFCLRPADYKKLYRNFALEKMFEVARQGEGVLRDWLKKSFDIELISYDDDKTFDKPFVGDERFVASEEESADELHDDVEKLDTTIVDDDSRVVGSDLDCDAIVHKLYEIALSDDENFSKTERMRAKIYEFGGSNIHDLSITNLYTLWRAIKG